MKTCRECGYRWSGGRSMCPECYQPKPVTPVYSATQHEPVAWVEPPPSRVEILSRRPPTGNEILGPPDSGTVWFQPSPVETFIVRLIFGHMVGALIGITLYHLLTSR